MKIELHEITIREITEGYKDNEEEGVVGFGGKLNIRPKYQREFVYDEKKRRAVIDTIVKDFPLNVMYWVKNSEVDFEVMDGQQRTVSFCQYVNGDFSVDNKYFHNLTEKEKEQILNYKLLIYFCEGDDKEKLDWFRIINIAGEPLYEQELRNATYTGEWLTDAKRHFSKTNCAAYGLGKDYVIGSPIRQDYLETALSWISEGKIEEYMSIHQHDQNASKLWRYFKNVIDWVSLTFTKYRKEMKGVAWGYLYNKYKENNYNTDELEERVQQLMLDDDVEKKSGIYSYILTGEEKHLSIRAFKQGEKRAAYERQQGKCPFCVKEGSQKISYKIDEMEADHITPWSKGGKTNAENCQMLCKRHNRQKSDI